MGADRSTAFASAPAIPVSSRRRPRGGRSHTGHLRRRALGSRARVVGGARYESDRLEVDAYSTLGSPVLTQKLWNDLLPSLALNLKLSETQQLRFSASRTLARPEYRELSPII